MSNKIREWRRIKGWTLEDLSEKTGISVSQLSRIERGGSSYTKRTLTIIAKQLGTTSSKLLGASAQETEHDMVLALYRRLNADAKKQAIRILRALAEGDKDTEAAA